MNRFLQSLAILGVLASSIAGCGVRTHLSVGMDGSVPIEADASRRDGGPPPTCSSSADCDDGSGCNGEESCVSGLCRSGSPIGCVDPVECTRDECIETPEGPTCISRPDDALCPPGAFCDPGFGCSGRRCGSDFECEDGNACNGVELCGPEGVCITGAPPPSCDDGLDCTIDSCDGATGACTSVPDSSRCVGGVCDPMLGCTGRICMSPFECDDGRACNGAETCAAGTCVAGPRPSCDDGVACTVDVCSDVVGGCTSMPNSGLCAPGQICDARAGCVRRDCGSDFECDDGSVCNGSERCASIAGGRVCVAGTPVSCDDGQACTVDRCLDAIGGCFNEPGRTEICGNAFDDDCDGLVDCGDFDCSGAPGCPSCTPIARFEIECFDGRDDDCDGSPDCIDSDCFMQCGRFEDCGNFVDDDGDGLTDCGDPDCAFDFRCGRDAGPPPPRDGGPPRDSGPPRDAGPVVGEIGIAACTNGIDDDGDGRADCRDSDCSPFGPMGECCNDRDDDGDGSSDVFTCRCFDNSTCAGVGDLEQVCWVDSFSVCAPRCNFYGGDAFCRMYLPDMPRCDRVTGECRP